MSAHWPVNGRKPHLVLSVADGPRDAL